MQQQPISVADALAELHRFIDEKVAAAMAEGVNWKLVINGAGASDMAYVMENHGHIKTNARRPKPRV